jgi:hypothetical protein
MSGYVLWLGGDHMLSQKLLVDVGIYTFAGGNPLNPLLIPLESVLSAFLPERQVHTNVKKLFHIENHVFTIVEAFVKLNILTFRAEL